MTVDSNETDKHLLRRQASESMGFSEGNFRTDEEWMQAFVDYIDELSRNDLNRLLAMLYRVDVDEKKIKQAFDNNDPTLSSGSIFADLLFSRLYEKAAFRKKYTQTKTRNETL